MNQTLRLIFDCTGYARVCVPKAADRDPAKCVKIFVAVCVEQPRAVAIVEYNGQSAIGVH